MKDLSIGAAVAITIAVIGPVWAQAPGSGTSQPQSPHATYPVPYASVALTPEDAYRQGLINRWQLEQLVGPTPQALQGPSVDGTKGGEVGVR
jgi:hypothetical protein